MRPSWPSRMSTRFEGRCTSSCGTGPVVMIDDDLHEKVDAAKVKALSDGIRQAAQNGGKK